MASFSIRSFRFQFSADVLSTLGFEMETLILGWYILIETDSAFFLALVGALRFGGTLISPLVGVLIDRVSRRQVMIGMRCVLALIASCIIFADLGGVLGPSVVLCIAGLSGLLRPAEHIVRNALIGDTVPQRLLPNAVGFSRTTSDTARIFGALTGAGLLASVGIGPAYIVVTFMYITAVALTFGITNLPPRADAKEAAALRDLATGFRYIKGTPVLLITMYLAVLANLTAFPLTHGLLPAVARDVYGLDEIGLAQMAALAATGSLVGSLMVAGLMRSERAHVFMLIGLVVWHALVVAFALVPPSSVGWAILAFVGVFSSAAMTTMAVLLLHRTAPELRGRVMGIRMLAVYGLPVGLMIAGVLIDRFGVIVTLLGYGTAGLIPAVWVALRWHALTQSSH